MMSLILMPVFNERKDVLEKIVNSIRGVTRSSILVIDDGSSDPGISKELNVDHIIRHHKNMGYGKSLIDGFNFAVSNKFDIVITIDGDGQHDPRFIPTFLNELGGCDIVNGTRHHPESKILSAVPEGWGWDNKIITDLLNKHFNMGITDSTCGYRAYAKETLRKLKPTIFGYGIDVQILAQAGIFRLMIREVAIPVIYFSTERKFKGIMSTRRGALQYHKSIITREIHKFASTSQKS